MLAAMRSQLAIFAVVLACRPSSSPTPPSEPEPPSPPANVEPADVEPANVEPANVAPAPTQTTTPPAKDVARELGQAAELFLSESRCTELAKKKSGLYSSIVIRAEVAATGDIAKIIGVDHKPDRKAIADCYVATLKTHRLERSDGGDTVAIEITLPRGALDKDIIRRVVRQHLAEVRTCYETGLQRDPALKGRASIQFTIAPTGEVAAAVVADNTLKDATVGECIAAAVKTWKFPAPEGGGNVVVTYPFVLEST